MSFNHEMDEVSLLPDSPTIGRKRTISPVREENKERESFEYISDEEGDNPPMSELRKGPSLGELKRGPSIMGNSTLSPLRSPESPSKKSFVFK